MAGFGIVEAAQRAREWMPRLNTPGQRLLLAGLVVYTGADSVAHPSVGQLSEFTGYQPRSVSRILAELIDLDVIAPISERSKGRQPTRWTIKPCPGSQGSTLTGESGNGIATLTGEASTLTGERANPDPIGSPLEGLEKVEKREGHSEERKKVRDLVVEAAAKYSIEEAS